MSTEVNKNTTKRLVPETRDDLTGRRFSRILVVGMYNPDRPISRNNDQWWCVCDCANGDEKMKFPAYRGRLLSGAVQSCGCLSRQRLSEGRTKHGMSPANNPNPLYATWEGIKARCLNIGSGGYARYGGRGIKISEDWKNNFESFYRDMSPTWKPGLTLDRVNINGDYCKENCRWATPKEQANNRSTNVLITMDGETKTKMQWCEQYGIKYVTVCGRERMGWSIEDAIKTPAAKRAVAIEVGELSFNGKTQSVIKWALEMGVKPNTIYQRLNMGWPVERALTEPARKLRLNKNEDIKP